MSIVQGGSPLPGTGPFKTAARGEVVADLNRFNAQIKPLQACSEKQMRGEAVQKGRKASVELPRRHENQNEIPSGDRKKKTSSL